MGASQSKNGGWCPQKKRKTDTATGDDDLEANDEKDRTYDSESESETLAGDGDQPGKSRGINHDDDAEYDSQSESREDGEEDDHEAGDRHSKVEDGETGEGYDDPDHDNDNDLQSQADTAIDEEDSIIDLEDPENPGRDDDEEDNDDITSISDKTRAIKERRPLKSVLRRVDRDFDRAQRKGRIFPQLWIDKTIPDHDDIFDRIFNTFRCQDWENALAEVAGPNDLKFKVPNPGKIPRLRAIVTFK